MDLPLVSKAKIAFLFFAFFLLILGSFYLRYVWTSSVQNTTDQALRGGSIAATALPKETIKEFALNDSDLNNPKYVHFKNSLVGIKNADPSVRFAYVYVYRQGKVYFVADSESVGSKDYSPPGQEFSEASSEDISPIKTGKSVVTAPSSDRWGTWVSALVPMVDDSTGQLVAVFGVDYPAKNWDDMAIKNTFRASGIVAAIFILFVAVYFLASKNITVSENEKNYTNLFESIDDIVIVGDKAGKILYANSSLQKKLGYTPEDLQIMHVLDLNPKDKRAEAEQIFGDMLVGKRTSCPLPLQRKDGSLIPSETRVWFGKWNGKDCLFGIVKDIGQEQELLQKFNKIFDNNPALMAISSMPERKLTDVNKMFLSVLGFSKEEVIGKTAAELNLYSNIEEQQRIAEGLKKDGYIKNIDVKIRKKSGEEIEGIMSGEVIENQGKSYLVAVMIDQTERNRALESLTKKNLELESMNKLMVDRELKMIELKKQLESTTQKT